MDNKTQLKKVNPHIPGYKTLKYFIMLANKLNESRRCHARRGKRDRCIISYLNEKSYRNRVLREAKCIRTLITNSLQPLSH